MMHGTTQEACIYGSCWTANMQGWTEPPKLSHVVRKIALISLTGCVACVLVPGLLLQTECICLEICVHSAD